MRWVITILLIMMSLNSFSRDIKKIDNTKVKCSYVYRDQIDTIIGKYREEDDLIYLLIGEKYSKSYSYYTYQHDSLQSTPAGRKEWQKRYLSASNAWKASGYKGAPLNMPFPKLKSDIYKNYPIGKMTIEDRVMTSFFKYEEDIDLQKWEILEDSTKTIMNHECQMATCKFRGRVWSAWFALDIPISDGPWKFCGLPGLIMEVYDRGKQQYFCINGLQYVSEPIYFGCMGIDSKEYEEVTQKQFLKAKYDDFWDRNGARSAINDMVGLPTTHKYVPKFDWLEREGK